MRLLLDSHVLVWLAYCPHKIGRRATDAIKNADELSAALISLWELSMKFTKQPSHHSLDDIIKTTHQSGIILRSLRLSDILNYSKVVLPQKDPFDRMLAAQSQERGYSLLTADRQLLASSYKTIDARL